MTLEFPDKIKLDPKDTIQFISAKLFESGRLSLGQAAELAGLSKMDFADIIGEYSVALVSSRASGILQREAAYN